ncbi:hypothetical protein LCGC14_2786760, partial [marine sediment metagenome]
TVAGGMAFVASKDTHRLTALDAVTGEVRWSFTAGGPIDTPPTIHAGRALFGCRNGWVYALAASDGELIWRFRAAPTEDRIIAHGQLESPVPAFGSVIAEGQTVYCSAGRSSELDGGVHVYALDAATGKQLWRNGTSGVWFNFLPHNSYGFSGVAPQGYLLASEDVLLVPTGRSVPAGYDRKTGRLLFYEPGRSHHGGGTWSTIEGKVYYSPGEFGREMKRYALATGKQVGYAAFKAERVLYGPAFFARTFRGKVHGRIGRSRREWSFPHEPTYEMAQAGQVLLLGGDDAVTALNVADGKELWKGRAPGQVRGIAVADGRLIVTTHTGEVHCLASASDAPQPPRVVQAPLAPAAGSPQPRYFGEVLAAVKASGASAGYALIVGEKDAALAEALARRTGLHILAAMTDQSAADA